ncbi:MAG: DUF4263 domain-containing protein [Candidatus Firestonebacteria bacterium]|nr:DUF4263 domain-containing protein [Candidatus Firestonebacteria bacterium]
MNSEIIISKELGSFLGFHNEINSEKEAYTSCSKNIIEYLLLQTTYDEKAEMDIGNCIFRNIAIVPDIFYQMSIINNKNDELWRYFTGFISHHGIKIKITNGPAIFSNTVLFKLESGNLADISLPLNELHDAEVIYRLRKYFLAFILPDKNPDYFNLKNGSLLADYFILSMEEKTKLILEVVSLKEAINSSKINIVEKLLKISKDFKIIIQEDKSESIIHDFLKDRKEIFDLSIDKLQSKPKIGEHFTDFAAIYGDGSVSFIEIERPNTPIFKEDGYFYSSFHHALEQVENFLRLSVSDREYVKRNIYDKFEKGNGKLIIGLRKNLDYKQRIKLNEKNNNTLQIEILTFDDLLDNFNKTIENLKLISRCN